MRVACVLPYKSSNLAIIVDDEDQFYAVKEALKGVSIPADLAGAEALQPILDKLGFGEIVQYDRVEVDIIKQQWAAS